MTSKYELSLAKDYVPGWTITDAVRELFQNALDQEVQSPANTASWEYDPAKETLRISNKTSVLQPSSLLLGGSTKSDDDSTIGQFGEGYKIATLVLLRNDKPLIVYNYGKGEVWRPRFVKSRRFGLDVLTFFVESHFWDISQYASLVVEVQNISPEEYKELIVPSVLQLQNDVKIVAHTELGDVIDQKGRVYVNGLFVCDYEPYKYGYNFKPGTLKLDRDRKLASDFDLKWLASRMWAGQPGVMQLIEDNEADTAYVSYTSNDSSHIRQEAYTKFYAAHSTNCVPVVSQEELKSIPDGYEAVIVPQQYSQLIKSHTEYVAPEGSGESETTKVIKRLNDWCDALGYALTDDEQDEFQNIVERLEELLG